MSANPIPCAIPPLSLHGIDRLAHVMRGSDLQEAHYAEVTIDLKLHHVRSKKHRGPRPSTRDYENSSRRLANHLHETIDLLKGCRSILDFDYLLIGIDHRAEDRAGARSRD